MAGILYVVFNKWIINPETQKMPYKIGITSGTVEDRYYGLGLKMPGKFETIFAYLLEDYKQAETFFQNIFKQYHNNGEWFNLEQKQLDLFKLNCEEMGGIDVKDKVEIQKEPINKKSEKQSDEMPPNSESRLNPLMIDFEKDIKHFFENRGFVMRYTPGRDYIYSRKHNQICFGIMFYRKESKYKFHWATDNERLAGLEYKLPKIQEEYKNAAINTYIREKNHKGILILVDQNNVLEDAYKIMEKTRSIVGF